MDVGQHGGLYAPDLECVAHPRLVDFDHGLSAAVLVARTRHLFLARQGRLEGGERVAPLAKLGRASTNAPRTQTANTAKSERRLPFATITYLLLIAFPSIAMYAAKGWSDHRNGSRATRRLDFREFYAPEVQLPRIHLLRLYENPSKAGQPPRHEADHASIYQRFPARTRPLVVFAHPPVLVDPRNSPFHYPPPRQH
jgi:hypothetical protein